MSDILSSSLFPCWAVVSQMGHRTHYGLCSVNTELGIPLLVVDVPGVDGDDEREPIAAGREIVAPASLYGLVVTTEAAVMQRRAGLRPWKPGAQATFLALEVNRDELLDEDRDDNDNPF